MHRLAQVSCAATLVALLAACSNSTPRHDDAVPAGLPSSSSAPVGSAGDAPAATPTPQASSSSPGSRPVKVTRTDPADLIIHPDHIGALKIGMSLRAAKATGLIVVNDGQDNPAADDCVSAHWKGQSDDAWMVFNGKDGLRALASFGDQKTPEGIRPGSTLASVRRAYPHLTWRLDEEGIRDDQRTSGDALADVVKDDGAHYRINIQNRKVTDVLLESDRSGCYE